MSTKRSKKTINKELSNDQGLKQQHRNKDEQNSNIPIIKGRGLGLLHKRIKENKNVTNKEKKQLLKALTKAKNDTQNDTESNPSETKTKLQTRYSNFNEKHKIKERINKIRVNNNNNTRQNEEESNLEDIDMDISDNEQDFVGDDHGNNINKNKPLKRKKRSKLTITERKNNKNNKKGHKEETSLSDASKSNKTQSISSCEMVESKDIEINKGRTWNKEWEEILNDVDKNAKNKNKKCIKSINIIHPLLNPNADLNINQLKKLSLKSNTTEDEEGALSQSNISIN
eukprot:528961_1